jgi:hypothetical protein
VVERFGLELVTFNQLFQDGTRPFEIDHTATSDPAKPELGVEI